LILPLAARGLPATWAFLSDIGRNDNSYATGRERAS
jgi:hypothetical protein